MAMKLQPYLYFDGRCRDAFTFYQQLLGGEITIMMPYGERPEVQAPPNWSDKILHATVKIGDEELLGADAHPDAGHAPQGFEVTISLDNMDEAERIFAALGADGGSVRMPLQQTFWAKGFGMVTDRFGVPWMINCG